MNHIRVLDQLSKNWGWIALRGAAAIRLRKEIDNETPSKTIA